MLAFRKLLQILPLILVLLASQMQAKPVFACFMDIDGSGISQYDHKSCPDSDYDDLTKLNAPVSDLVLELDIDPSGEKLTTYNPIIQLQATLLFNNFSRIKYSQDGSKILLITQRLRI